LARFGSLGTQYFDDSGDVLTAGYIQFYASGTSTPITTYADASLTIANEWPVPLDASGRQPNIFFDGTAKATLRNSAGTMIATADPVGETGTTFGAPWSSAEVYQTGDIVLADDGNYYEAIADSNQNHYPPSNAAWWEKIQFLSTWNANVTYADEAIVELDGILYTSQQNTNLNHDPSTDAAGTWWLPIGASAGVNEQLFAASGTWTKPACNWVQVELWGAGGGGGNGYNAAAAETRGGGSGGGGGRYNVRIFKASDLASTVAVTIGAGGAAASVGGNTSFGSHLIAYGGAGGTNGDNASAKNGGQPGGSLTAGNALSGSTYGTGDETLNGAAGGSGGFNATAAGLGLRSLNGGPGGGGGGGLTAANAATAGGAGGSQTQGALTGGGGAGGAATGAAGSAGSAFQGGGGGGAGGNGGAGGAGGAAGGGGGGGAGLSGTGNAAGGVGGNGYARIRTW
jgi:hypothetical protein